MALLALSQRVGECGDMARGFPDLRGQNDRGVQAHDIVTPADNRLPPLAADVFLEFDAEGAVVPCGARAAVDLRGRKDKSTSLTEIDDGVHAISSHWGILVGDALGLLHECSLTFNDASSVLTVKHLKRGRLVEGCREQRNRLHFDFVRRQRLAI